MATKEEIWDQYQDVLLALEMDLETGSHHFNNLAHEKFAYDYPKFMEELNKLGKMLDAN